MKRVVIADDSQTARMFIRRCLEIVGLAETEFVEADNGREALARIKEAPTDLLVTDLNMPLMDGEMLLMNLDMEGVCLASGSACTAGAVDPSHVLQAMGLSKEQAQSSLRISLGKDNTSDDIDYFLEKLEAVIDRLSK